MSSADCERWVALSDQVAVGEALSDRDQTWLESHARGCCDCGREAGFYLSLRDAVGRPEVLVLPTSAVRHRGGRKARIVAIATVALAASVAMMVGVSRTRRGKSVAPQTTQLSPIAARLLLASGIAHRGVVAAQAGQTVGHGDHIGTEDGLACMEIARSITVCLDTMSAATVALADSKQTIVYLEKGRLFARLDHQPAGRSFVVRTAQAEVQAVGTRFSVNIGDDGQTRVRLHEGKVAVRSVNHVASDLAAPAQASIGDDILVAPMPQAAREDDELLSDLSTLPRRENAATVHIVSSPVGADVAVDNVAMGKTPLSTVLGGDAHVRVSMAGYAPASELISVADGAVIERTFTLSALAVPQEAGEAAPRGRRAGHSLTPGRLLAAAQALRARGAYDDCARIYRRLWSEFSGSEEGKVSMISLGELELGKRNRPAAALEAFAAYVRVGGPLEREARYGTIRALRALGREREADVESISFLRDYPTSSQAATIRRKADER